MKLLDHLFRFIREDPALNSEGLLTTLLGVCPRWRHISVRAIWTDITLDSYFVTLNTRDFVVATATSQPLYLLHSIWPTNIYGWHLIKDGEYKDSYRKFEGPEDIIEGSPWVETGTGSRLELKNASSHTQK
jgi:hypothetical protein